MSLRNHRAERFSEAESAAGARFDAAALKRAARIAIESSMAVKKDEKVLIVTNPDHDVSTIARALYDAAVDAGARPTLVYQPTKTQMDFAEESVIAAFRSRPDVFISMSAEKLGKDKEGTSKPYELDGHSWNHIFHIQLYGEKTCRAFWSPSVTLDSFIRTVPIDYDLLKSRAARIKAVLNKAVSVRVTAPAGTDVVIGLRGREAKSDDGNFGAPGSGGNLPAGETFISPENGTASGIIAFDGSISLHDGDIVIRTPIRCEVKNGYIQSITGGDEAQALLSTVTLAEKSAKEYEESGKLPAGMGSVYAKNARNIGELGIGLNPEARVSGNMLEDEKAFRTCHFAVGHNYDEDAPALIHLDGLVTRPTIVAVMDDGSGVEIERDGDLAPDFI